MSGASSVETESSVYPLARKDLATVHPAGDANVAIVSLRASLRIVSAVMHWLGPYSMAAIVFAIVIACSTILRLAMLLVFVDVRSLSSSEFTRVFLIGLRYDLLVGLVYCLMQVVHVTLFNNRRILWLPSRIMLEMEWLIGFLMLPFLCVVEYLFFFEFDSRLNYIAFEYLVYPSEVCCSIWQSYPVVTLLVGVGVVGGTLWWSLRPSFLVLAQAPVGGTRRIGILAGWLTAIGLLWTTIGTETHQVSHDRVANECAWNGIYSFVYHAWTCHLDYDDNYVVIDDSDAVDRLRKEVVAEGDRIVHGSYNPVDRTVVTGKPRRDCHVVLILEESFGSDFVGVLGDERKLSPNLDELAAEGILFDRVYATGNRTARALEAVLTSMPPIPTESILKRDRSQHVFTIANVLAERGYERLFMTGGHGTFDGVRKFMTQNGFNHFIEQSDFKNPVFENAWGVADEDLFGRAIEEFDRMHETGHPFFATVLTVSNHRPFTFPAGRIDETRTDRDTAVKYADWALGKFFRDAKSHAFYKDTIFVVMGDHGARVYGSQFFPMSSYRVPVLMILPEGEGRGTRCHTLACSLDIAPTILGQLGGEYRSVFFGRDAMQIDPKQGRAVMQHNHDVALLDADNRMVVLGFGKTMFGFQLQGSDQELKQLNSPNPEMLQNVAAYFQSAFQLYYSKRWYPDAAHSSPPALPTARGEHSEPR